MQSGGDGTGKSIVTTLREEERDKPWREISEQQERIRLVKLVFNLGFDSGLVQGRVSVFRFKEGTLEEV